MPTIMISVNDIIPYRHILFILVYNSFKERWGFISSGWTKKCSTQNTCKRLYILYKYSKHFSCNINIHSRM